MKISSINPTQVPGHYFPTSRSGLRLPSLSTQVTPTALIYEPWTRKVRVTSWIYSFLAGSFRASHFASLPVRLPVYKSRVINSTLLGELLYKKMNRGEKHQLQAVAYSRGLIIAAAK